mmetsp:Transcript_10778/g.17659  ORF Transcript_10778/g.17659 Transcript_10778/m.17659 type:complete len:215 (-) Transcript_10778:165-809(-)
MVEETSTIRPIVERRSCGISDTVNRYTDRKSTCEVISSPSFVSLRVGSMIPALLIKISIVSYDFCNCVTNDLTELKSERSISMISTFSLPVDLMILSRACSAVRLVRHAITTRAPLAAIARAVSTPIPSLAPVIRTTLSFMLIYSHGTGPRISVSHILAKVSKIMIVFPISANTKSVSNIAVVVTSVKYASNPARSHDDVTCSNAAKRKARQAR